MNLMQPACHRGALTTMPFTSRLADNFLRRSSYECRSEFPARGGIVMFRCAAQEILQQLGPHAHAVGNSPVPATAPVRVRQMTEAEPAIT
jgi:hypothetical protein